MYLIKRSHPRSNFPYRHAWRLAGVGLMLSGCLGSPVEEEPPLKDPAPPSSPSPIEAGKCRPGEDFQLQIDGRNPIHIPSSAIEKKNGGKSRGRSVPFWIWYLKALHDKKNPLLRKELSFPLTDSRLVGARFDKVEAITDILVFDADRIRWDRVLIGLDGLKGTQIQPSAVRVEILQAYDFDIPLHIPRGLARMLTGGDGPDDDDHKGKVWLRSFHHVRLHLDLKQFSFGGAETADDILRRAAHHKRSIQLRLRHIDGGFRLLDGRLDLDGRSPGDCPEVPPPADDTQAPQIQIESQSVSGLTTARSQTIRISSDEPVAFTCSLDQNMTWEPCSDPANSRMGVFIVDGLQDGSHQVSVRATDAAGNTSAPLTRQWTVDTTSPVLTLVSASPADVLTSSQSLLLEFTSSEASQISCSIDGTAAEACVSPLALNDLADGQHRIVIQAIDLVGLVSVPLVYEWRVQALPPSIAITSVLPSESPVSDTSMTVTFEGAAGTKSYRCSLDGAIPSACESPLILSDLHDGAHVLEVAAVDGLGRVGPVARHSWTVDTMAPEVFFLSIEPSRTPTSSSTLLLSFGASETASLLCSLDGAVATACMSPLELNGLSEGEHRIMIHAVDLAGNSTAAPAEHVWIIDQTPPTTLITAADPSGALINVTTIQLRFEASEAGTLECRVDSAAFAGCSSPTTFSLLAEGAHLIDVRAIDLAGNIGPVATHAVTVDLSAPGVSITSINPAITNSRSRSISFSSQEANVTFECQLNAAAFAPCTSPVTYSNLNEGVHVFRVRAQDIAGNVSQEPSAESWRVDLSAPETTITARSPSSSPTDSTSILFEFAANETGSRFECQRDNEPFVSCASPLVINNLADGPHTFNVRAIDEAGNVDLVPATYDWVVETTPLALSGFSVTNITRDSARVNWDTNRLASSRVEVTHVVSGALTVVEDPTLVGTHSVMISGLTANALYSVVAVSVSASGQTVRSSAFSFRTGR